MRIGLALPHYDSSFEGKPASWDGVRRCAEVAERSGLDSVWVSDHLFLDYSKYGGSIEVRGALECWTTMSALAACTQRIRIGSLTLCNDLRNPAVVAKMAATLHLLSQGRCELGLGAGWYEPDYRATGIEMSRPGVRIDRLAEAAEIIKRLLHGEELFFKGDHYVVEGALCRPAPRDGGPRLWIGGKGDRLLDAAARTADGWNFSWLGSQETYAKRAEVADEACLRHGRAPEDLARSVGAYVLVGRDEKDALKRFERLAERTPAGILSGDSSRGAVSWDEFRRTRIAGGVPEVTDRLGALRELGVQEVVVGLGAVPFQVSDEEDIELIGTEIIPALRTSDPLEDRAR
ncbi:MAG: LLM class flavin-dependent oxidoreductase [Actinobacteria bacterium]|nr:LLM class flavin-dependent oxidoreductase [Actinomycetota bacterium]